MSRTESLLPVYGGLLLCAVFWGATFPAGRVAVLSIPPMTVAFIRFAVAGALLEIWVRRRGEGRIPVPRRAIFWSAASGILGYSFFFFNGLKHSSAIEGSLIVPTNNPLATLVLASLVLGERLRAGEIAGLLLALGGVFTVVGGLDALRGIRAEHLGGNLLFLGCVLSWATYTVLGKIAMSRVSPLLATTRVVQVGAALILPAALLEGGWKEVAAAPAAAWVGILTLALPATVLAYVWWYNGTDRLGAARAGMFTYLVPPSGVATSWLLLDEPVLPRHLWGAALIAAGLAVANWGGLRRLIGKVPVPPLD